MLRVHNQFNKNQRMGENRGRRPHPSKPKPTNAVFTHTPDIEVPEALLIGDSIIKNISGITNTQVIGLRGLRIEELSGLFENNQIPAIHTKDIIVTHIGTNNVRGDSDEDLLTRTKALIRMIKDRAPTALLALSQIIPRPCDWEITETPVKDYNMACDELRIPMNIKTIPTYKAMQFGRNIIMEYYSDWDHLHPSTDGDEALRQYLSNKIARLRQQLNIKKAEIKPPLL